MIHEYDSEKKKKEQWLIFFISYKKIKSQRK